ncbi:MAG: flagellar biosynthesis protein FlhB [Betaproteobacteria bacterium]|nr:flagellar biosynthesis protein FlhB [Betaproteobacteria bacterium]
MAEGSAQDRTEEPTARRLRKARDDGQVARSMELPAAAIVIGSMLTFFVSGGWMMSRLTDVFAHGFVIDPKSIQKPLLLPSVFAEQMMSATAVVLPVILLTMVLAIVASSLTGGFLFSLKAAMPKASKLSMKAGLQRMFGTHALVELAKACLKFILVSAVLWWSVLGNMDTLVQIGRMDLEPALHASGKVIIESILWVSLTLAVIAMIDVPWQRHQFTKRMRMTKQEVKDEFKEMEGNPEIKAKIRRRQREMATGRMMQRVKDADVVITNPQHFAVALEYDPTGDGAPLLVAKGVDLTAARIREEAGTHGVHIFEAPELARALYFTTDLEQPVPEDLYQPVAQVIAYVFSLEAPSPQGGGMLKPDVKVPPSMRFNTDGRKMQAEGATR